MTRTRTPAQRDARAARLRAQREVAAGRREDYAQHLEAQASEPNPGRRLPVVSQELAQALANGVTLARAAVARAERELATAHARPDTWASKPERVTKAEVRLRIARSRLAMAEQAQN